MSFVYPWFLLSALAISIPILIHLFHFRKFKKVYFSNTNFLEKISDETEKQSKLKHLLVLLARILAICCLVMAFARPFIPVGDSVVSVEGNAVCVYLDNSFSMEDVSVSGNMLDLAKEKARELVSAYDYTDEFMLLTNDFEGKHQRFVSRDEFISMLNEVRISPAVKNISEVSLRQGELLKSASFTNRTAYIISDFQENISNFEDFENIDEHKLLLIPVQVNQVDNLFIDSVWTESPIRLHNQTINLFARIQNHSEDSFENQPIRLFTGGVQRGVATFNVSPFSNTVVSLSFTVDNPDFIDGFFEITDYPITFDNNFFFSFKVTSGINVLSIYQEKQNTFLNALFAADDLFSFRQMTDRAVDFSMFQRQDLIILDGINSISGGLSLEILKYVGSGGNLLVFPSESMDIDSYMNFLNPIGLNYYTKLDTNKTKVSDINPQHYIYKDVFDKIPKNIDLPIVDKYFVKTRKTDVRVEDLLVLQNGAGFLSSYPYKTGTIFLCAVGLSDEFSNFQRHSVFVPSVYNIALQSKGFAAIQHVINSDKPIIVKNYSFTSEQVFKIKGKSLEFIPQKRTINNIAHLYTLGQLNEAGIYSLVANDELIDVLAFNYDRRESETLFMSVSDIRTAIADNEIEHVFIVDTFNIPVDKFVLQMESGRQLWALFLLLALVFLFAEVLMLRFLK